MASDVLLRVQEAELKAKETVDKAKIKARDLIDKAKSDSDEEYEQIILKANKKAKKILMDANDLASKEKEPTIKQARDEASEIKNQDKEVIEKIIRSLKEGIIENGNS
ncbi:MAG: ATPase V [Anaerococcus sp.]|nr:ATPase V [Anaerococcus sp.]